MEMQQMINDPNATIVDVRTPMEYQSGHVEGSTNIPLDTVPEKVEEFKLMSKPLILCCASGNRSGQAAMYLQQLGVDEVYNGGGWMEVNGMRQS